MFIATLLLVSSLSLSPTATQAYGGGSIIIGIGPRIEAHNIPERMDEVRRRVQQRYQDAQEILDRARARLNLFLNFR